MKKIAYSLILSTLFLNTSCTNFFKVEEKPIKPPKYLIIEPSTLVLRAGDEKILTAFSYMEDGETDTTNKNITWDSDDRGIVDIDEKGKIKAVRSGETSIYAKYKSTTLINKIIVTVIGKKTVEKIVISPDQLKMKVGDLADLIGTVYLLDGTKNGNITWSSADDTIANVSPQGKVSAKKVGITSIIATYNLDPIYKQAIDINVVTSEK